MHYDADYLNGMKADYLWLNLIRTTLKHGVIVRPRGFETREIFHQTTVVDMLHPLVTIPERKLNYAFAAAEARWILDGSDDLERLTCVNSEMAKYSDDGKTLTGAYGPRIASQLRYVIETLANDPDSRQAVLTIWRENPAPSKDIPCLAGDTIINSPEGDTTIVDLAKRFASGTLTKFPVFAWNKDTRKVKVTWMTNAWCSGKKRLIKLTFDDGSSLKCTPDHMLWKKTRQKDKTCKPHGSKTFVNEIPAGKLTVGDRVWATQFIPSGKKRRLTFIEDLSKNWHFNNQKMVHIEYARLLYGGIPDGYDVHHKNDDANDNRADNLEVIPHADHSAIKMYGDFNPMRQETSVNKIQRRLRLRKTFIKKGYKVKPLSEYQTNHIIVHIEELPSENVYDFTVPDGQSCSTGTGVLVHNCTVALAFYLRNNLIHVHAFMRSSDIWRGWPYDVFSFSVLGYYVTLQLSNARSERYEPGNLYLTAGSSHLYESDFELARHIHDKIHPEVKLDPTLMSYFNGTVPPLEAISRLYCSLESCEKRRPFTNEDKEWRWLIRPEWSEDKLRQREPGAKP